MDTLDPGDRATSRSRRGSSTRGPARPGDDLPEVPGEGPEQRYASARPWPTTCGDPRTASRSWRGRSGRPSGPGGGAGAIRPWRVWRRPPRCFWWRRPSRPRSDMCGRPGRRAKPRGDEPRRPGPWTRSGKNAAATREQLWKSLTEQGRAERLSGLRWGAIEALGDAARVRPSDELAARKPSRPQRTRRSPAARHPLCRRHCWGEPFELRRCTAGRCRCSFPAIQKDRRRPSCRSSSIGSPTAARSIGSRQG